MQEYRDLEQASSEVLLDEGATVLMKETSASWFQTADS
jgi:hypothetical protein